MSFFKPNNLYYNIQKCLFVWPLIDSAPGVDRMLRLVSLEPVWLEVETIEKNFSEKWAVAKLPNKMLRPLMLFNGKILLYDEWNSLMNYLRISGFSDYYVKWKIGPYFIF